MARSAAKTIAGPLAARRRLAGRAAGIGLLAALALGVAGCGSDRSSDPSSDDQSAGSAASGGERTAATAQAPAALVPTVQELTAQALEVFGRLPRSATNPSNRSSPEKIALGRRLYADARLSKNHDVSCNSCHRLDRFGVDGEPTSPGHQGQRGGRNSPTSFNAAIHIAQFWDGRAADVEEQAKGPVLNPIEMAMPDSESVETLLRSIPGYAPLFAAAFPGLSQPITFDNMALAIAAFERELMTPGPLDAFLAGDPSALDATAQRGLGVFMSAGCIICHNGPAVGGALFQKLGLVEPYETEDQGRFEVTGNEADRFFFKVPSLRNIAETGPYFHDGGVSTLPEAVRLMAKHQLGKDLSSSEVGDLVGFLESLTGTIDPELAALPELPPSGPDTPAPDPS